MALALNYDKAIQLDAEDLAEVGIAKAYEGLLPELRKYVSLPALVEEIVDDEIGTYMVRTGDRNYTIFGPGLNDVNGWTLATVAFFDIVNKQLVDSEFRFYAINGGNDLFGIFLTPATAFEVRASLPHPRDWPYLPTNEPPWYGHNRPQRSWWRFWN